ncbi:hypothetical protein JTE90_019470 [Oedothorax gibbosus]|uniref:Uncharacterized protein n=1 Tax=Oedothorax gibbosus TaxID=931172 RepID=A0AAV6UWM1_9ARAC|nr:hypothetical protein JTE90_019470 [Oedothorax gibbosus]
MSILHFTVSFPPASHNCEVTPQRDLNTTMNVSCSSVGSLPLNDPVLACYLEADEPPLSLRRPFPRAEVCVLASLFASFLGLAALVLLVFRLTGVEGEDSLLRHTVASSQLVSLVLVSTAAVVLLSSAVAYAAWRVMEVLDMAHRYKEHRELCAYEEMRASFRSQNSGRSTKRSSH